MLRFILFLALTAFATNAFAAPKSILIIESYHSDNAWDARYLEGLRETFGKDYTLASFEMDTKRLPKSLYQKQAKIPRRLLARKGNSCSAKRSF
jgi:hypothetical protein